MKTAVQFGAGNIGRGFIGQLLWESEYETIFIEAYQPLVSLLRERGSYPLRLLEKTGQEVNLVIDRYQVIWAGDDDAVSDALTQADIAFSAVGAKNLPLVARLFAQGIRRRAAENPASLNVLLCENLKDAPDYFSYEVSKYLEGSALQYLREKVGFVGTVVARMVPVMNERFGVNDPLLIVTESYHRLPCDRHALKGTFDPINGVIPVDNFPAEEDKKLYIHNLGHATLAYLGYRHSVDYIHQAMDIKWIRERLEGVYGETVQAILNKYPDLSSKETAAFARDLQERFRNPMMMDTVKRVGRDPLRKLAPGDRLVGGIELCLSQEIFPENITTVYVHALAYDSPDDPEAVSLQRKLNESGIETVLREISALDPASPVGKRIIEHYEQIR